MMTRNLATEVAPKVRVNAIAAGGIATDADGGSEAPAITVPVPPL
jgi:NAD(P)-dependent dehydrogenase (short-subunit alcohol dehydrogenase family)